jgi:tetratricopeptide (TPR) repeat protein
LDDNRKVTKIKENYITILIGLLVIAIIPWPQVKFDWVRNQLGVEIVSAMYHNSGDLNDLETQMSEKSLNDCRLYWLSGFVNERLILDTDPEIWRQAMRCSPQYVSMLSLLEPDNLTLAEFAVTTQPGSADAWFWMAGNQVGENVKEAIELYKKGLAINPYDGRRWRELGDLLVAEDPNAAIDAYLQSCYNGDPGYHGCYLAGKTAQELGEIEAAKGYYRLSLGHKARKQLDALNSGQ